MPMDETLKSKAPASPGHRRSLTSLRHFVPGQLLEVTMRCFQSHFLLVPSEELERTFIGVLGKAQQLYKMKICYFVSLSNHAHLSLLPDDKDQLEGFQRYFACNLSREVGRLRGWREGIFRRRYSSVPVTDAPEAEAARIAYLIGQGMKEGVCPCPLQWIGPHAIKSLVRGQFLVEGGVWTDRTALGEARREHQRYRSAGNPRIKRRRPKQKDFQTPVTVELSKIPSLSHLSDGQYAEAMRDLLEAKKLEHAEVIETISEGWQRKVRSLVATSTPKHTKRRPKPFCHAATKAAREQYRATRKAWIDAYDAASERFRQGVLEAIAEFPENAYLPRFGKIPDIPPTSLAPIPDTS